MTTINRGFNDELAEAVANCEGEKIQHIGQIQPTGIFLALDDQGLVIASVSENVNVWLPYAPSELLGKPFSLLVGHDQAESIRQLTGLDVWRRSAITTFKMVVNDETVYFDAQISRSDNLWLVEIECEKRGNADLFHDLFIPIRDALWQLDAETNIPNYTSRVVEQVRLLTGYDRVMMYQFDENWDGEVIAECKADEVESYLGNRFPASDIPPQARHLYTKNLIRLIADIDATPVSIISGLHPQSESPLDMTYSCLRALSPVHIEYLRNMGVCASLSISLIQNNKLWGLIACHHTKPKYIPIRIRELEEFIGKTVSLKLSSLENNKKTEFHENIRLLLANLMQQIQQKNDIEAVIELLNPQLLSLVHANGAVINLNGHRYHLGETPSDEQENEIDNWLKTLAPRNLFQTDSLAKIAPRLTGATEVACGLMVAPLDSELKSYIAWYRNPVTKTIKWAGNPDKIVKKEQGKLKISPRQSFATWVETFSDKALPWSQLEIDAAHSLSLSIIEVLNNHALKKSEQNYRFLAENSSDLIARFCMEGRYTFVSPACKEMFGVSVNDMIGQPVLSFVNLQDRAIFQNTLAALANSSDSETVIFRPQSGENSGTIIWLEYTLKLATNDESGLVEIIANGRDITQRHTYQLAIEDLHRRNSLILEAAGDGLVSFDTNGRIVYCNERATQILGWEPGELLGHYCCELFHVPSESEHASTQGDCIVNESILRQESISSSSSYLINKDGNQIQAEFVCTPMQVQGQYCGAVLVFNQRHEREHDNHQLRTQDAIINESSEAVMVTDINRRIISVNPAFIVITGYSADEAIGNTPRLLKSGVHTPDFYAAMMGSLAEKNYWAGEIWNRRKNGEIYPQWGSITAIFDENENLTSYIGVFSDVSKSKQAEERLYYLANHDSLTGLANRSKFVDHLSHLLERHRRTPSKMLAVAFIDIDQFKIINDKLGHAAGDLYLKAVSERIVSVCRTQDLVSRWGGDEFVLVMENIASRKTVIDIVTRILEVVNQPLVIQGHELEPTLSIGVSICPDNADNATDLVKAADTAMYRVKESGRNGFEFYSEGLAQANSDKFQIVSEFKRALRMNELILHYQPQVDAATGAFVGLEALVRWQHPERGLLGPISFIPLVEELGLINNLGEWVLKAACQQILEWKRQGVNCPRVAVNIAATQMNNALVDYVRQNLLQNGLSACVLEIELTESALTQDSQTISTMTQLREMGVSISIDDFGTGYSSLAHLTKFPITCIKIDKSFVDKLPGSKSDEAIVKTILALGNNLEVEVIVEGVETEEQRDFLISVGATRFQGYFYSKPLAVEEITQRLIMQESLRL